MPTNAPTLLDAFNAATTALSPDAVPAEDMRTAINRLTDALAAFVAAPVADKAVTLAKMADVATASVFYRKTAGTGVPQVQTLATLKTDLGLTGTNSGDQTFKLLPFTGVDGSGETPDLTCTFTGAPLGANVAAILDSANFSDARALFETTISAAGYIEQVSLTDLSLKTYLALLVSQ